MTPATSADLRAGMLRLQSRNSKLAEENRDLSQTVLTTEFELKQANERVTNALASGQNRNREKEAAYEKLTALRKDYVDVQTENARLEKEAKTWITERMGLLENIERHENGLRERDNTIKEKDDEIQQQLAKIRTLEQDFQRLQELSRIVDNFQHIVQREVGGRPNGNGILRGPRGRGGRPR
jgi:chromosome segregation ATPase